jgi:F420-non-reducing hydrogenase iron-sulfur subunit
MSDVFEPKILAFLCNWCSYAGADLAGVSRFQYPPNIRVMRTMCSGRVDPMYIIEGLKSGFDAVVVFGCHIGDCHYLDGNIYASKRMPVLEELLDLAGIGRKRTALRWVSAAEGQLFADYVSRLTQSVRELGPFVPDVHRLQLATLESVLKTPRIRWLTGMDRHLTDHGNVYGERVGEEQYRKLLKLAALDEYQKALILESLREGPRSVREMAGNTGLPVYTVSLRLNDLERRGLTELQSFEGSTPKFVRLAT